MDRENRNSIRIVRIINRFNLGGPTYNVSYLSRYMPDTYETLLVGGKEESHEASSLYIPESLGLNPVQIPSLSRKVRFWADFRAFYSLYKLIRKYKPHIVHTHASKAGVLGRCAALFCGVPIVVHTFHGHVFRNYFSPITTRLILFLERLLARFTDAIIAISPAQHSDLTKTFKICSSEKCHVIPLGFDLSRFHQKQTEKREHFRKKYFLSPHVPAIGIVGRLAPIKNHELFLDSLKKLKEKNISFKAFVVGDGERKEFLMNYSIQLGLKLFHEDAPSSDYDVCFTGWIRNMEDVLPGMDIVALSSLNEGTPVSLIEAQAAGKIVVSTRVGGVEDVAFSPYFLMTQSTDFSDFPDLLEKSTSLFQSLSPDLLEKAANNVIEKYHYQRLVGDMDKLYQNLLHRKKLSE